jgi:cellulose synthase/poly-beta-1,6-N-acetylglucosamine synthase-like glycosyltransferase
MSSPLELIFWACLIVGLYPYAGYPVCVALLKAIAPRPVRARPITPSVTVVISAFNEASHVEATVRNKLSQDYAPELLDVMIVSDGSTDGTDEVLKGLALLEPRVKFFRQEPRAGKTEALNGLVERAGGEIVVFSDANSMYRPDAVRRLVEVFADPRVGYASGRMLYVDPRGSLVGDGCTSYMRYENALRAYESAIGSVVGADGGIDAVRRALYQPMRAEQLPDFVLPLEVVEQGYRAVYVPGAVLQEETLTSESAEYRMRVRVALRSLWAIWDKRALLNPLRFPLFSWQLASHKLLRYLSFLPLGFAAAINWVLVPCGWVYAALAAGQCVVVLLAGGAAPFGPPRLRAFSVARYSYYFLLLNCASAVAFTRFVRGQKQVLWQPRTG